MEKLAVKESGIEEFLKFLDAGKPLVIRAAQREGIMYLRVYEAEPVFVNHENDCPRLVGIRVADIGGDSEHIRMNCECAPVQVLKVGATIADQKFKMKWMSTLVSFMGRLGMMQSTEGD